MTKRWTKLENTNVFRAVLDTNVFVSGGTVRVGAPSQIINHWRNQDFVMVISPQLVAEYEEVLQRPTVRKYTGLSLQETSRYIHEVKDRAYLTSGSLSLDILKDDPDDNIVLACADEGMATHLVTGNAKHFPSANYKSIKIVSPREFLSLLEK